MNRNLVEWNTGGIRPLLFEKISLENTNQYAECTRSSAEGARNDSKMMGKSHTQFINTKSQF